MKLERYAELESRPELPILPSEWEEGWRRCCEFDGMLLCCKDPENPEAAICRCQNEPYPGNTVEVEINDTARRGGEALSLEIMAEVKAAVSWRDRTLQCAVRGHPPNEALEPVQQDTGYPRRFHLRYVPRFYEFGGSPMGVGGHVGPSELPWARISRGQL